MATFRSSLLCARFDRFELDPRSGELFRSGKRVPIQDKPLQVLRLLLEAQGTVVTREQVRSALWPQDTFVDFEHGVNTAVKKLRQALEDSAERPKFVETLPRVGYRFLSPVEWIPKGNEPPRALHHVVTMPVPEVEAPADPGDYSNHKRRRGKWLVAMAIAILVVSAVVLTSFLNNRQLPPGLRSMWTGSHSEPAARLRQRRLTANPHDLPLTSGAMSPDGKYFAYTDSTGFYLREIDTSETHPVQLPKNFDVKIESWFPDSGHLVVSWIEDMTKAPSLWAMSILGGTPRRIADEGSGARVSPDGRRLTFLKGVWDDGEIWIADADGNNARKILDGGSDHLGPAAWAPDGKLFAFVRASSERQDVEIDVYNVAAGRAGSVLSQPGVGQHIAWVAPGSLIFSLREAEPNQADWNLWRTELDPRTERPSASPIRITNDHEYIKTISATSDGKRITVLRSSAQQDVYLAELDSAGKTLNGFRRFTLDERQDFPSAWTPDSKAVLVVSDRDGLNHIFRQEIEQTQPELLVGGKQHALLPRLTPDGSSMLYLQAPLPIGPGDMVRIMKMPLSGGPSRVVLEAPGIVNFACARQPAKTCVYAQIDAESYKTFVFNSSNGQAAEITAARIKKEEGFNSSNISPDGKYLVSAKSQNPYDQAMLRIFSLADGHQTYLSMPKVKVIVGLDWAADSKSIWVGGYMGRGPWGTRSGLVNIDLSGKSRTLIEGSSPEIMGGTPSPDGRHLALGANTDSSNAWLVENF
jgi:Tol biopolymer transport system component/DNA-binding winged helix-turn-helix (wHTH) protein